MSSLGVNGLTDLETKVCRGCGVGVAAEVLVDDVLIFAGTLLDEGQLVADAGTHYTYVCCLSAVLFLAWALDQAIS